MDENKAIKTVVDEYNKSSKSLNDVLKVIDVVRMKSNIPVCFNTNLYVLSDISYEFWSSASGKTIRINSSEYCEIFEVWLLANLDNLRKTTLDSNILVSRIKSIVDGLK